MNKYLTHYSHSLHILPAMILLGYNGDDGLKNSSRLAICALSCALSIVLLFFGGIATVFSYAMPMLVSLIMIMLKETFGAKSAVITYVSTAILTLILVNDRECASLYILFFGYYPIIRASIEKIKSEAAKVAVKFLLFNFTMAICQLLLVYVFGIPFFDKDFNAAFIIVFAVLMNILFVIYDILVDKMFYLYRAKIEKRIKKYFK